jgi:anti-anti-sigma regulatory factor
MPIDVHVEQAGEVVLVTLGGDLTAPNIPRLRETILAAFAASRHVGLEIVSIGEADVSFLQLLCAAFRTALAEGKELTLLNWDLPLPLRALARDAGFERRAGCPPSCGCWFAIRAEPAPGKE